jgi:hypothetical protein
MWADPIYVDIEAVKASDQMRRFGLFVGRVVDVENIEDKTYLNFGDNWRTDFTVKIAPMTANFFVRQA